MLNKISMAILSRKFPRSFRFRANFNSKIESWRVFSCSSFQSGEFRVSSSCYDSFPTKYEFLSKNFCSRSLDTSISTCWNCGTVAESKLFLTCSSCRSIQPLDLSINYFQIFELEKGYEIEDHSLERKYKDWQKKLHPDLVHTKSEKEREYAAEQSARVIDAYHTLRKPLSRAIYLLLLEGIHVDEEKTLSEPELLAEIMEIREAVEEAANSQALKQIQSQIIEKLKIWSKSFGNMFKNQKFEEAITSIQRMTYYERINEEIVKKL